LPFLRFPRARKGADRILQLRGIEGLLKSHSHLTRQSQTPRFEQILIRATRSVYRNRLSEAGKNQFDATPGV
jgi:hypothetical protein